jgi:hypothetical protein
MHPGPTSHHALPDMSALPYMIDVTAPARALRLDSTINRVTPPLTKIVHHLPQFRPLRSHVSLISNEATVFETGHL